VPRADELTSFMCRLSRNSESLNSWSQRACSGIYRKCFTLATVIKLKAKFVLKNGSLYKDSLYIKMVCRVVRQYIFEKVVVGTQELYMICSYLGINSYLRIRRYYKKQISLSSADCILNAYRRD